MLVVAFLSPAVDAITSIENALAIVAGTLPLTGLWTPLAGSLAALEETAQALLLYSLAQDAALVHAFLAVLSASVAMLGPGAWSIDATAFGRKGAISIGLGAEGRSHHPPFEGPCSTTKRSSLSADRVFRGTVIGLVCDRGECRIRASHKEVRMHAHVDTILGTV